MYIVLPVTVRFSVAALNALLCTESDCLSVAGGAPMQQSSHGQMSSFAGRMGNIMVSSMAGGFGGTLGSQAAHSLWNDLFH